MQPGCLAVPSSTRNALVCRNLGALTAVSPTTPHRLFTDLGRCVLGGQRRVSGPATHDMAHLLAGTSLRRDRQQALPCLGSNTTCWVAFWPMAGPTCSMMDRRTRRVSDACAVLGQVDVVVRVHGVRSLVVDEPECPAREYEPTVAVARPHSLEGAWRLRGGCRDDTAAARSGPCPTTMQVPRGVGWSRRNARRWTALGSAADHVFTLTRH